MAKKTTFADKFTFLWPQTNISWKPEFILLIGSLLFLFSHLIISIDFVEAPFIYAECNYHNAIASLLCINKLFISVHFLFALAN